MTTMMMMNYQVSLAAFRKLVNWCGSEKSEKIWFHTTWGKNYDSYSHQKWVTEYFVYLVTNAFIRRIKNLFDVNIYCHHQTFGDKLLNVHLIELYQFNIKKKSLNFFATDVRFSKQKIILTNQSLKSIVISIFFLNSKCLV